MKNLIISKTLLFLFIVLFISGFSSVFGEENSLIGVTIVIALLMYLERDLTVNPWRNFFMLLGINLLQGIFGHLALMNPWLGIPLNFLSIFFAGYFFTYNVKKSLIVIFGLQYLFMLYTPVSTSDLPLRLLALASGAVLVMVVQLIVNKDKLLKAGKKHLLNICDKLIEKLDSISTGHASTDCNQSIETSIKELKKIIFFRRHEGYYLSNDSRLMLKISACLEKLYILLNRFDEVEDKDEVIAACMLELENVKLIIDNKSLETVALQPLQTLKAKKKSNIYINELSNSFELLFDLLEEVNTADKNELKKIEKVVDIPFNFKKKYQHFINFNRNSVRFTFAIRLAIMITVTTFIFDYFDLQYGMWLVFTMLAVTQPYSEQAKHRFSARIIGTLIGAVIFTILFGVFTDPTVRTMIILLFGYLNSFAVQYRTLVLTVTVCSLGSAAMVSDPNLVVMERIFYIVLGVILGMIANRLIFPHSIQKGTSTLVQIYRDTSKTLMEEVYHFFENHTNSHSINNLYAVTSFIEDRILLNNETMELNNSTQYLEKQRKLNNGIYELFLRIQRNKINPVTVKLIIEDIDQIMKSNYDEYEQTIEHLKKESNNVIKIDDKIILKDVIGIYEEFKNISLYPVELKSRKS